MDERRLARIHLVSRRFPELQGLRTTLAGSTVAVVFGSYMAAGEPTHEGALTALIGAFALMLPGQWWLHRHYARTVGRQVSRPARPWPIPVFVVTFLLAAMYLNTRFPQIPAGAPTMTTVVGFSVLVAIRDWPWRAHYLGVAAAVGLVFSYLTFVVPTVEPGLTLSSTFLATGLSLVPAGLLDHRLLTSATARREGR